MATFVLVHGAWSGSFGFRKVRPLLREAGHEVFTPSLTGIGERAHLTSPQVTLTTHITDVVNTVLYEDMRDIVLLGFSYGGMVVTGALEHIADRVRHLVYLDAFLPENGDSVRSLAGGGSGPRVFSLGSEWLVPPPPREYDDPQETAWASGRRTPQPAGSFTEPVRLLRPLEGYPFTRTYIKATGEPRPTGHDPFWAAADRVRHSPAWRYREIATNHMIPSNRPDELARLLLEVAGEHPSWDLSYTAAAPPPWDIGRPQPVFERLAAQGLLSGRVLDAGCGTGEHTLLAAAHGADAVGVDVSPTAIRRARDKAAPRGLTARFEVADALELGQLGLEFDAIIDSGLFHVFDDEARAKYVASLASVLRPGGTCYLMCFSDRQPGTWGPRRVSREELTAAFADGWQPVSITPETFDIVAESQPGAVQAWLAILRRE